MLVIFLCGKMRIKAVLFDMFDTLAVIDDNYEVYNHAMVCMHKYIIKQGIEVTFEQFREVYIKARNKLNDVADKTLEEPHFDQRVQIALKLLGYDLDPKNPIITGATEKFFTCLLKSVRIDENAKSTLENLHDNYKLGIISNYSISEGVHAVLKSNKMCELFDVVVVSCDVNKRKPSPEIFQIALKKMNILAEEAVFVGDRAYVDISGAHATGMKAIYVKRRFDQDFEKFTPDIVIDSLAELPYALNALSHIVEHCSNKVS